MLKKTDLDPGQLPPFWVCVLLVMPALIYAILIGWLHQNLPIHDDYVVQLEIGRVLQAGSLWEKLKIIYSQLNEHRLVYTRLWFLVSYFFNDGISYSALIFIGNLPLVGIWLLLLWWLKKTDCSPWAGLCIGWLLFQFQFYENSLWAMAALQNITIHFFYLLLFTLLVIRSRAAWTGALILAVLICFTSGNGFLVLVLGAVSLVFQRRWRHLMIWAVQAVILFTVYFYGFESISKTPVLQAAPSSLQDKMLGIFAFLGQGLAIHPKISDIKFVIAGGVVLGGVAVFCVLTGFLKLLKTYVENRRPDKAQLLALVLIQSMAFVIISAAALSYTRISEGNYQTVIASRYQPYPTMLILCVFCFFVVRFRNKQKIVFMSLLPMAMLLWLLIFQKNLSNIYYFRDEAFAYFRNTSQLPHPDSLIISKVFKPDPKTTQRLGMIRNALNNPIEADPGFPLRVSEKSVECSECRNSPFPDESVSVVLSRPEKQLLYPGRRNTNAGTVSFWLKGRLFADGFVAPVNLFFLHADNDSNIYRIGVLKVSKDTAKFYLTRDGATFRYEE